MRVGYLLVAGVVLLAVLPSSCRPAVSEVSPPLDSDGDGWTDTQEAKAGTDPRRKDSDDDGYWDPQDPNPLDASIPAHVSGLEEPAEASVPLEEGPPSVEQSSSAEVVPAEAEEPDTTRSSADSAHTPVYGYALERNLPLTIAKELHALDEDGYMDPNERALVDYLVSLESLMPVAIRHYYSDDQILSNQSNLTMSILSDGQVSTTETDAIACLRRFERWNIVRDVIHSGMVDDRYLAEDWDEDGLDNLTELQQGTNPLNALETDPGNLSARYAILAGFSNVFHDPNDPTILVPTDLIAHDVLEFYHVLRLNGYDDAHISLFLYRIDRKMRDIGSGILVPEPIPNVESGWVENEDHPGDDLDGIDDYILPDDDRQWKGDDEWARMNLLADLGPVQIDFDTDEVTIDSFLNEVSNLSTDENDVIFIYYASHGVGTSTPGEGAIAFTKGPSRLDSFWGGFKLYDIFMRHYLLNRAIRSVGDYSRMVIMQDGCNTGAVLKDLDKTDVDQDFRNGVQPSPIRRVLALSATLPDESQSGVGLGHFFINVLRQDPYESVSGALRRADQLEDESMDATDEHSIMYYFDTGSAGQSESQWGDSYSIVAYTRARADQPEEVDRDASPLPSLPFSDDFGDGTDDGWGSEIGDWTVVAGEYTAVAASGLAASSLLGHRLKDFVFEADLRIPEGGVAHIGLRVQDLNEVSGWVHNGVVFVVFAGANQTYWHVVEDGSGDPISGRPMDVEATDDQPLPIRVVVIGDSYDVYLNGTWVNGLEASEYAAGQFVLGMNLNYPTPVTWDNIVISIP